MFKRATLIIFGLFAVITLILFFTWREIPAQELYSNSPVIKAQRITYDLSGKWNCYSSLRQAWFRESRTENYDWQNIGLSGTESIVLPSDKSFKVVAKKFKVKGIWSFKTAQLVIEGVYGKARVFLNGIEEKNYLGEYEGIGGIYTIDIQPTRLNFSEENTLYIELSPSAVQQKKAFHWLIPDQTKITGSIRLEAVPETTIDLSKTTVSYDKTEQEVIVNVCLKYSSLAEYEPWAVSGEIKDGEQIVAECLVPISSDGSHEQQVDLVFNIPDAKLWSPASPYLYTLKLVLLNERGDYDSIQLPIGFSVNNSTPDKWIISGKQIQVNGNILTWQQESEIRNKRQIDSYLQSLKETGINTLYFLDFFPDEEWLYAADKFGIGVWLELPVELIPAGINPYSKELDNLIRISQRHPSVMAWTVAKGLEPSPEATSYLEQIAENLSGFPVYYSRCFGVESIYPDLGELNILQGDLQGEWGKLNWEPEQSISNESLDFAGQYPVIFAVCWLIWLLIVSIQNIKCFRWSYKELFVPNPKRKIRHAFAWSLLALLSRKATLAGLFLYLFYLIPEQLIVGLLYNLSFYYELRYQEPLLLWLFLTAVLILLRLFNAGVAAYSFPQQPEALGLCCWLERRYLWLFLVGAAFFAVVKFELAWYVPFLLYIFMTIITFPGRVKDVHKVGGKYFHLIWMPINGLMLVGLLVAVHIEDFLYLVNMVLPEFMLTFSENFNNLFTVITEKIMS